MRVGNRQDFEKGIRLFFMAPFLLVGSLTGATYLGGAIGAALGGALAGAVSYGLSEGVILGLRKIWPPKATKSKSSETTPRKKKRRPQLKELESD